MKRKDILIKKRDITKQILQSTKKINKAIEEEDAQKITRLLETRQKLIEDSERVDVDLENLKISTEQVRDNPEIVKIIDEIVRLLENIKEIDDDNIKRASQFAESIKAKITELKQTGNAMKGYGIIKKGATSEGAFIDMKK